MNFYKAIAKVEKMTGQKADVDVGNVTVYYKGYRIQFFCNGQLTPEANATCYSTCRQDLHMDTSTDYFPQTFHDNITQCVKFIDRMYGHFECTSATCLIVCHGPKCYRCGEKAEWKQDPPCDFCHEYHQRECAAIIESRKPDVEEPIAEPTAPALAQAVIGVKTTSTRLEIACLDANGNAVSFDSRRPETLEEARQIVAESKQPKGNPDYDNYWLKQNYAIRRVTTIIETLERDRSPEAESEQRRAA